MPEPTPPAFTPPQDPVITPDGYLFSKEAILENLLAQAREGLGLKRVEIWLF